MSARGRALEERFWSKVTISDGCWEWQACIQKHGYGSFSINRASHLAHRVAYQMEIGPIPPGLEIDHLCLNRACIRPDHLEAVTRLENAKRGSVWWAPHCPSTIYRNATHCVHGHLLDRFYEFTHKNGRTSKHRRCSTCAANRHRQYQKNKIAAQGGYKSRHKTICKNGHEFTPENTLNYGGTRSCKQCTRKYTRDWKRARRAK